MAEHNGGTQLSGSEMQLLIQMLDGIGRDTRSGFERMDRKIEGMIPRPEFTSYQEAVARQIGALEHGQQAALTDRGAIRDELDGVVAQHVRDVDDVRSEVRTVETNRLREFKALNIKLWSAIGTACLGGAVSLWVAVILAQIDVA